MPGPATSPSTLERKLAELTLSIKSSTSIEHWQDVQQIAQNLADVLRVKDANNDIHTLLGRTELPDNLSTLLRLSLRESPTPDAEHAPILLELLRVSANLCLDHDGNRAILLEKDVVNQVLKVLEGYASLFNKPTPTELLSIVHLKIIRTAIGVLLNASIGFDPVKQHLASREAAMTILTLSAAIYRPGIWLSSDSSPAHDAETEEAWNVRVCISNWSWRAISELRDAKEVLGTTALPLLIPPLALYISPPAEQQARPTPAPLHSTLLLADFDCLEEASMILESLSLDVEDVRLSLARGFQSTAEHNGVPCLSSILDFIERGHYSPLWSRDYLPSSDIQRMEKTFAMCKAALIKSVVEMAGEEHNEDVLWDYSESDLPGGQFVCRMIDWIKGYVDNCSSSSGLMKERDDLVVCATLSLGNLTRREKHARLLLSVPHSLASVLATDCLLGPDVDIKVKHGVVGLLKHLSQASVQSPELQDKLTGSNIVRKLSDGGLWDIAGNPMAEVVQLGGIGVTKYLCNGNIENTFTLALAEGEGPTPLERILSLMKRSDSVPIKSEGARILVNVAKSLWIIPSTSSPSSPIISTGSDTHDPLDRKRRDTAIQTILKPECAGALASLVARSARYPVLINEGVVALSLMSTNTTGAMLVTDALLAPLDVEISPIPPTEPPSATTSSTSGRSSPVVTPSTRSAPAPRLPVRQTAADMLIGILENTDNPVNFPVEIRMNVCSLLLQVGKRAQASDKARMRTVMLPVLEAAKERLQDAEGKESLLRQSIEKAISSLE